MPDEAPSETPDAQPVYLTLAPAVIRGEARKDGYRPICDAMCRWAMLAGTPSKEQMLLIWSGARRLDSAHRQIERVRAGLRKGVPGSIEGGEIMHEVIGDGELAMIALDKALDVVASVSARYRLEAPVPSMVIEKRPLVRRLRDHYGHIDERALGQVKGEKSSEADGAWGFVPLLEERRFTDGKDSLGLDAEATELCIAARGYLLAAWTTLIHRGREAAEAEHLLEGPGLVA